MYRDVIFRVAVAVFLILLIVILNYKKYIKYYYLVLTRESGHLVKPNYRKVNMIFDFIKILILVDLAVILLILIIEVLGL